MGFGTGKNYRDIPVHTIYSDLSPAKSSALPLFHSLTGCDTTSQFLGCGKKTAWAAWRNLPELTDTLVALTHNPDLFTLESVYMQTIERFVVLNFSCTARGVVQLESMRPGITYSPLEAGHWRTSHLPKLRCSSM